MGPLTAQYAAAGRYLYGWIENRLINITKGKMISLKRSQVISLVESDDEDGMSASESDEVCSILYCLEMSFSLS